MVYVKASVRAKAYNRKNPLPGLRKLVRKGSTHDRVHKLAKKLTTAWAHSRRSSIEKRFSYVNKLVKKHKVQGF